ncbi:MAG: aldose 1-epimerase family protein [Bacteroidetes bacterium]|nr:aldose 1-epimerase family protein [Bacteroidota bacterium]
MPVEKNEIENTLPLWKNKISNPVQIGGIETSVLDNGLSKGTRIAWINTGAGLRYKIVIDRAMDIADAFYNQYNLAWLSHIGITSSQPFSNQGVDWLKTFGGGLLTTCGLSHTGGPEIDEYGQRGLHGEISNLPAEIESVIQPDPASGKLEMSITGIVKQSMALGPNLELRRTISGKLGSPAIQINDVVINRGNQPAPLMLLYHCNFGWPLADEGTDILWNGEWQSREGEPHNKIFNKNNNFRKCTATRDDHAGRGEEAAYIDISENSDGECYCGLYNSQLGIAVSIKFYKKELPWLVNWQHWGRGEYVTGLEPATLPPIGQAKARAENKLIFIKPGESKTYRLEMKVLHDKETINHFINISTKANK